jgi:hypothetical protein
MHREILPRLELDVKHPLFVIIQQYFHISKNPVFRERSFQAETPAIRLS